MASQSGGSERSVVVELDGLRWATEKSVVEAVLGRRPGVAGVAANSVAQTATVTYDSARTTVEDLAGWVRDCGYHCRGESVRITCAPRAGRPPVRESTPPPADRAGMRTIRGTT
jgi:Cu2+-exporting ATPase